MRRKTDTGKVWVWTGTAAIAAALALTGLSIINKNSSDDKSGTEIIRENTAKVEPKEDQTDEKEVADQGQEQIVRQIDIPSEEDEANADADATAEESAQAQEEETADVAAMIEANKKQEESKEEQTVAAQQTPHFTEQSTLQWPVEGKVLQPFSMDATVYFPTLQQYKYNPALLIEGEVNEKVTAAAGGTITDISTNEETGCTVTMDLGDGYSATYGQLKELSCHVGDYVEAGALLGHVSEPTKYYTEEGTNLYFRLQKNDTPIDPLQYLS